MAKTEIKAEKKTTTVKAKKVEKAVESFEYSGMHFTPVGTIKPTMSTMLKTLVSSEELGMVTCACAKRYYDYATFRTTADYVDAEANVFKCEETGKLYVPFVNELMEYTGKV